MASLSLCGIAVPPASCRPDHQHHQLEYTAPLEYCSFNGGLLHHEGSAQMSYMWATAMEAQSSQNLDHKASNYFAERPMNATFDIFQPFLECDDDTSELLLDSAASEAISCTTSSLSSAPAAQLAQEYEKISYGAASVQVGGLYEGPDLLEVHSFPAESGPNIEATQLSYNPLLLPVDQGYIINNRDLTASFNNVSALESDALMMTQLSDPAVSMNMHVKQIASAMISTDLTALSGQFNSSGNERVDVAAMIKREERECMGAAVCSNPAVVKRENAGDIAEELTAISNLSNTIISQDLRQQLIKKPNTSSRKRARQASNICMQQHPATSAGGSGAAGRPARHDECDDGVIHVRARRGQATDSHSLAERVRRAKISQRMKHLQELVPGCTKVLGKAAVLEEIINYVKSLQYQIEVLSMRLASSIHHEERFHI